MTIKRLIEVAMSALQDTLCCGCEDEYFDGDDYGSCSKCREKASELIFAILKPREKGKWVVEKDERYISCSECGLKTTRNELAGISLFGENEPNFCPNCGADMRS